MDDHPTYYYVPLIACTALIEHGFEISNLRSTPMFCPSSSPEIFVDRTSVVDNPVAANSSIGILYLAAHSSYNFDGLQYGGSSHCCTQDLMDLGSTLQQKDYTSLHQVQFNQNCKTSVPKEKRRQRNENEQYTSKQIVDKKYVRSHVDWREKRVSTRILAPKGVDCEIPHRLEMETKHSL